MPLTGSQDEQNRQARNFYKRCEAVGLTDITAMEDAVGQLQAWREWAQYAFVGDDGDPAVAALSDEDLRVEVQRRVEASLAPAPKPTRARAPRAPKKK